MKGTPHQPMNIVLVQPSKHQGVTSLFTFHKNEGLGHKPPLGLLTLATYLIHKGFKNTRCIDAQLDNLTPEKTATRLATLRPDVVGFSAWTEFWYPTWKSIALTREYLPHCTIIVGGPHCLEYARETLEHSEADYAVAGDGEDTLLGLMLSLQAGCRVDDLPGLWRKKEGRIIAPKRPTAVLDDLDKIPGPDRTLLPYQRYNSVLSPHDYETTMITSRGCPYRCSFCKIHSQTVCARSAERVVEEFREIAALGITDIQVYDDTFTWSRQRVIDICTGILDSGINVRWAIRDRVNRADPELYRLLKAAQCHRIHFGVESGSQRILEACGKGITLEQAQEALQLANDMGFTTLAYYMFGFPDETYSDALSTIAFATNTKVDYAVFAVLIPYPGTTLYTTALERGIIPYDFWLDFAKKPVADFSVPHLIEHHMDRNVLIGLKNKALRKFYLRPGRVLAEATKLHSWRELRQKAGMAGNIISDSLGSLFAARSRVKGMWDREAKGVLSRS